MQRTLSDPTLYAAVVQHLDAGRVAEAASACETMLAASPHDWLALRLRGIVCIRELAFQRAAMLLKAALALAPSDAAAIVPLLHDLAEALRGVDNLAGAIECYRRILDHHPHDVVAHQNCGSVLVALNRHAEALDHYRCARTKAPDSAELRLNEGLALLALGAWDEAWDRLEARFSVPQIGEAQLLPPDVPHWRGASKIAGSTILLQAEQGLGDTIQFVRYASMVTALGARVALRVQPGLRKILTCLSEVATVVTFYDPVPAVDLQCPLMSLPLAFRTTLRTVPAHVPYLRAAQEYLLVWGALLGQRRRTRIGVAWYGRQNRPSRSMPLARLEPLLRLPDFEFHTLQREMPKEDRAWLAEYRSVVDHTAELDKDFADTAAVISLMDLVITIDTSIAHLAGALGKPVWIMLPFSADCRWMLERGDTPWYPTARLFRQRRPGDWDGVVSEVVRALSG